MVANSVNESMDFVHQRVAHEIRSKVVSGVYKTGERMPRQHDLAKAHNVAFNTLKKALDILEIEGYVARRIGQGTYAILPEDRMPFALVVDDDENIRHLLERSLAANGWRSVAVGSGLEALDHLKDQRFNLIFLDLVMPDMKGSQVFKEIREANPSSNVVIITAFPDSHLMAEALDVGPFALMRKPFSQNEISSLLQTFNPGLTEAVAGSGRRVK